MVQSKPTQPPDRQPEGQAGDQHICEESTGNAPEHKQVTLDYENKPSSDEPVPDLLEDLVLACGDRYEHQEELGKGGFGSVFSAFDRRLNRKVAIKATAIGTVGPEGFLREARAVAQLRHPGIVTVFDVAVGSRHCFVMSELLSGPTLSDWARQNPPSPAEAARIVAEISDALAHAHSRSIVHRDLKPSNIMINEGRQPVVVDFGLAITHLDHSTDRGKVSGTPSYMSPEQAGGRGHRLDGRTDIYGLAATLYSLLCGRPPFRNPNPIELLRQVQEDDPQPPRQLRPEIPPALEAVCLKGLSKLPADRFTTASDFAEALRKAAGLIPSTSDSQPSLQSASPPAKRPQSATQVQGPRAERRQITLLQLSCTLSPGEDDDPLEQVASFQAVAAKVVEAHGGLMVQSSGGSSLACFGYPVAHEDAPRQAIRAALAASEWSTTIQASVGTGAAVVTQDPGSPPVIVGEITALVGTATAAGGPGTTITEGTFRLVGSYFETSPSGEVRLRGAAAASPLYRVTRELEARSRIDAAGPAHLAPLVGRDREAAFLLERWELAGEGVRNVILLVADPGLGKSRLVRTLKDQVLGSERTGSQSGDSVLFGSGQSTTTAVIEWFCSPYHQGSPFYPVMDYFDRTYQLGREPEPGSRLNKLIARLRADGVHDPEEMALFAAMLSIPPGERLPALALSPDSQKERTVDAVLGWLAARTEFSPVLFVVEDLHWVDPSTESLLARFVEMGGESRVLGIFTFRPEYEPPWKGKSIQTQVALNRLTRSQVGELVRAQAGADVSADVVNQIVERTDGVPLFVEEFTRLVADVGKDGIGTAIPASLQDLLLARLDRMASDREVVQLAATIGRTFNYDLILAATDRDEAVLRDELRKLVEAGLLFPKGTIPRCTFTFKHALIQDAAYQSLIKKTRQQHHRRVAEALEVRFPEIVENQPEIVAHHLVEAGETARSHNYWRKAGVRAQSRSAHLEALRHLERGLELLSRQTAGANKDSLELGYRLPLSGSFLALRGYGSQDVETQISQARELCERLGTEAPLFHVLMISWALRFIQGRMAEAQQLSLELLALAEARNDDGYRTEAHWTGTCTAWWAGDCATAFAHGERAAALHSVETSRFHAQFTSQNSGPLATVYAGLSKWALGYPDQAVAWGERAVALADRLAHPFTQTVTYWLHGLIFFLRRDPSETIRWMDRTLQLSEQQSYVFWTALARGLKGSAFALLGRYAEALPLLEQGLAQSVAVGSKILDVQFHADRAEALWRLGRREEARSALALARDVNDADRQRNLEAEVLLHHAMFLLEQESPDPAAAEERLKTAMNIARCQGARFYELRASVALARIWKSAGKVAEAGELVRRLLAGFSEGENTPDLIEAREIAGV